MILKKFMTRHPKKRKVERFSYLMKKINTSQNTLQALSSLFVDKNHPPNGIDKAMWLITADGAKNVDLKIIAIAPSYEIGSKILNLPFSLGFVETCLKRSLETGTWDFILMFCRMYKGFNICLEMQEDMDQEIWDSFEKEMMRNLIKLMF